MLHKILYAIAVIIVTFWLAIVAFLVEDYVEEDDEDTKR
jgi:hypothetical protein